MYLLKETIWLNQQKIAGLFGQNSCNQALKNVFSSHEPDEEAVRAKIKHTAADGKIYSSQFYNLDAIISVG